LLTASQVVDLFELALLKLPPPPLPSSWGRVIKPYAPAHGVCRAPGCQPTPQLAKLEHG
jgi:hypothetical protein